MDKNLKIATLIISAIAGILVIVNTSLDLRERLKRSGADENV